MDSAGTVGAARAAPRETPVKYFAYIVGFGVLVTLFVVGTAWPDAVDQLLSFIRAIFRATIFR